MHRLEKEIEIVGGRGVSKRPRESAAKVRSISHTYVGVWIWCEGEKGMYMDGDRGQESRMRWEERKLNVEKKRMEG